MLLYGGLVFQSFSGQQNREGDAPALWRSIFSLFFFDFIWFTSHCSCHEPESSRNGDRGEITDIFPAIDQIAGYQWLILATSIIDLIIRSPDRIERNKIPSFWAPAQKKKSSNGSDSMENPKSLIRFFNLFERFKAEPRICTLSSLVALIDSTEWPLEGYQ